MDTWSMFAAMATFTIPLYILIVESRVKIAKLMLRVKLQNKVIAYLAKKQGIYEGEILQIVELLENEV